MLPQNAQIQDFTMEHYDKALALWRSDAHIGLSSADERAAMERFLRRNRGLCKVVFDEGRLVGTILCGHDGRRGYIYHLHIQPEHRRGGLGTLLVNACLDDLRGEGIRKCHLFIFKDNEGGKRFWASTLWKRRDDIEVFSMDI